MVSATDLIIRMQPYSKGLKSFIFSNPDVVKALKITNYKGFISLGVIIISSSPLAPEDKVIGFYVYDYKSRSEKFKQDFIVDIGSKDKEFILYTRFSGVKKSKKIRDINDFSEKYSKNKYYVKSHHLKFEQLPKEIKPRALKAIELSKKLKEADFRNYSKDKRKKIDLELRKLGL